MKWRDVNKELPKLMVDYPGSNILSSGRVIVFVVSPTYKGRICFGEYRSGTYLNKDYEKEQRKYWIFDDMMSDERVTYWMPSPLNPETSNIKKN